VFLVASFCSPAGALASSFLGSAFLASSFLGSAGAAAGFSAFGGSAGFASGALAGAAPWANAANGTARVRARAAISFFMVGCLLCFLPDRAWHVAEPAKLFSLC